MSAEGGEADGLSRREQKKALHRRRILETAREVFFRDGFVDANLDEVAQRAGVAKGTLYRYFESKADLYVAVLAHNGDLFAERMRRVRAEAGPDAAEQIRRIKRFYLEHWTANPEYFQIFWAVENQAVIGDLPPSAEAQVTRLWEECLEVVAASIEQGIEQGLFVECDAWEVANVLWTVANGLIQTEHVSARRRLRRIRLERIFDDAIELLLRGMRAKGPGPGGRDG